MIRYEQYARIHHLRHEHKLSAGQIAAELSLDLKTVAKWLQRPRYEPRKNKGRSSKLDPHKGQIRVWLEKHPYSAQQLLQLLRDDGYQGGYSILKDYVRKVRPRPRPAYLTLSFAPGQCAQVDWGSCGTVAVGNCRRRLSFFAMVLSCSRLLYVEFTLSQQQEQFLQCHENAFAYFGGVPHEVMLDNLKSGVLAHRMGQPAVLHPRYAEFARHWGFRPLACNPRAPQEKGRVENAVGYIKKNFLAGRAIDQFAHLAPQARRWLDEVANLRVHRHTGQSPRALWEKERAHLQALPLHPYDTGTPLRLRASSTFRLSIDGNRYSVPAQYASQLLDVHLYAGKLRVFHQGALIAEHLRSYERGGDFENPEHPRALLAQRHRARVQKNLQRFLQLGEHAEIFYRELQQRRLNPNAHIARILALAELHGREPLALAIADAHQLGAYASDYIANILDQRRRPPEDPGPLHLTRPSDLLELESPAADLSLYLPEHPHAQRP